MLCDVLEGWEWGSEGRRKRERMEGYLELLPSPWAEANTVTQVHAQK